MIKRKESTRRTRHIEPKAFFFHQWSARPEVRLAQVKSDEMLADGLTKGQWTPNSIHRSRIGLEIEPIPAQF